MVGLPLVTYRLSNRITELKSLLAKWPMRSRSMSDRTGRRASEFCMHAGMQCTGFKVRGAGVVKTQNFDVPYKTN